MLSFPLVFIPPLRDGSTSDGHLGYTSTSEVDRPGLTLSTLHEALSVSKPIEQHLEFTCGLSSKYYPSRLSVIEWELVFPPWYSCWPGKFDLCKPLELACRVDSMNLLGQI